MKTLKYIVTVFIFMLILILPLKNNQQNKSQIVYHYTGTLYNSDILSIYSDYKKNPFNIIVIESTGGDYHSSMVLGEFVRTLNIKVIVHNLCASACTIPFFMANTKDMEPDAKLALHNISLYSDNERSSSLITVKDAIIYAQDATISSSKVMLMYVRAGVPLDVLDKVAVSSGHEAVFLSREDLVSYGILKK